jgi:hypothetical protein
LSLQNAFHGQEFDDDDSMKAAVKKWLHNTGERMYHVRMHALIQHRIKGNERDVNYMEKHRIINVSQTFCTKLEIQIDRKVT